MHHKLVCTCRALSVSAALFAALAAPGAAFASPTFTDVNSDGWYVGEVAWVADEGIMGGYGDGTFGVGRGLTRAEFAQLLASWAAAPEKGEQEDTTGLADLIEGGQWYTGAANWAVEDKVIMGVDRPDGTVAFEPDTPATREMVVTILWRMATQLDVDTSNDGTALAVMPDADEVSEWAQEAMAWAVDRGIITGVVRDDGSWVEPGRTVLREEIAKIVHVADEVTGGVFEGFAADDLAPVKATIKGTVSLEGRDLAAGDFSFELRDEDGNAVTMVKSDAEGTFEFNVEIGRTGVFRYSIATVPGDLDGITYDEKVWQVEVISTSEDGALNAEVVYPEGEPKFEMSYESPADVPAPGPDPVPDPEPTPDPDPDPDPDPEPEPDPDPDNPVTEDGITFEVVEEGDEDAEYGAGAYVTTVEAEDGAVSIPAELNGTPVVSISLTDQASITSVDVSASGDTLKNLEVTSGGLAELNLSGCTELEQLDCSGNVLVGLDASDCISLDAIDCSNNYLQSITLPGQTATTSVSLLAQTGAKLKELDCSHNQIAALDLSGLDSLVKVDCSYNRIEDLSNIQEWAAVEGHETTFEPQFWNSGEIIGLRYELQYCDGGYIEAHVTGFDAPGGEDSVATLAVPGTIEGCPVVSIHLSLGFDCVEDGLLDLTGCDRLRDLYVDYDRPMRLDASGCTALVSVVTWGWYATSLDFSGCSSLTELRSNLVLESIDLSGCRALESLDLTFRNPSEGDAPVGGDQIAAALEDKPALRTLELVYGELGDLPLPELPSLTTLSFISGVTSVDLSGCPELEELDCDNNLLESLDVSGCPALHRIDCSYNRIADLSSLREWAAADPARALVCEPQLAGEGEI